MGACVGLIKSVLKHIFRLWTDVHFVESCARWRLQATPLEVIALAALLAQSPQILFGLNRMQIYISGGDDWRGHHLPAHAGLFGTAPALLSALKCVFWPLSVKMNQLGLCSGNKRAFVCSGSLCLTRSGETCLGTVGPQETSLGWHRWILQAVCLHPSCIWSGSRNLSCCQSHKGLPVDEEFWKMTGDSLLAYQGLGIGSN